MQIHGNQSVAQPGFESVDNKLAAQQLAGRAFNGEKVVAQKVTSPLAKAADLAEEMVQFVKDNKTDLKGRNVKKGKDAVTEMRKRVEKIQTLQNVQEIKDFLQKLKANPNISHEQIQEMLKEFFDGDTLHESMGLNEAVRFFDGKDKNTADRLKKIRNKHFADHKVAIRSGINISEAAAREASATGLSDTRELRETHVDLLGGEEAAQKTLDHVSDLPSLKDLYRSLTTTHDDEDFLTALEVHLKLLAVDLSCLNASTSHERLNAIIKDLSDLKILVGLHDGCVETGTQMDRMYAINDGHGDMDEAYRPKSKL